MKAPKTIDMQLVLRLDLEGVPYKCNPEEYARKVLSMIDAPLELKGISLGVLLNNGELDDICFAQCFSPKANMIMHGELENSSVKRADGRL